jgi:von Willebrand factor type A domain
MVKNARRGALALALMAVLVTGCAVGTSEDEGDQAATASNDATSDTGDDVTTTTTADDETREADDTDQQQGALLLVMDASGSMNQPDAGGQPLIEGAKQALHDVVAALPDGIHAGLRVYGHRVPNTDRENGCRDTELISQVAPLDRNALNHAIDGYQAVGFTPIGLSLQQGAGDLPPEGPRTIVLVSDGEDTCAPPDPCQVASELRADGVELVIHTVGFALPDDASRQQLECIAQAGGGEFHDAGTAAELADTLEDISAREARRYETSGVALEGAPIPRDANTGQVGTAHVDTVLGHETNYYHFEIEPGTQVRGEMIVTGNPHAEGLAFCANLSVTDRADQDYAYSDLAGVTDFSQTQIEETDPVVVDADEVWLKIVTDGCGGSLGNLPDSEFDVEFQLTVVDD